MLTLSQTKKLDRPVPVLLYGKTYWQELINFEALVQHGMISGPDLDLIHFVESPAEALSVLKTKLSTELQSSAPAFAKSAIIESV